MAFIKKHLCGRLFKYLLSGAISEKVKRGFAVFFVSADAFRCLFSLGDDESTNLAVIEGRTGFNFSDSSDRNCLSVAQRLCLPRFSLSFT